MKNQLKLACCSIFTILVVAGCRKDHKIEIAPDTKGFVSATSTGSFTKLQLQGVATTKGFGSYLPLIQYDVDFYKIVYITTYKGKNIKASGTLGIPKNTPAAPALLSAQHGTIFSDGDVPSNFPAAFTGFELFASAGLVTVIPDFIGYGESKTTVHPYYDMRTSGLAVADMLTAVKYYLKKENKAISSKLFLVGYSEGGYVTMAAQKEIETNPSHGLTLTAAAEGAGGYDVTLMLNKIATAPTYPDPSFFALFLRGYDATYSWNRPLTDFFPGTYAAAIPQLLDGTKNSDQINAALTDTLAKLFTPTFYSSLTNPAAEPDLKARIAENSFPNWYPKSPTRLYHGTADEDVFFETSQSTYTKFLAAGATNLTFIPIPGATHETGVAPMMLNVLPWFIALEQQ